jgi:hypothetical protein
LDHNSTPVRETGEGGVGGERAPGEGEEGPALPSCNRRELACRGLRAAVGEEPAAVTRWRGGVGEKVWEHLHCCQGGRPPPGVGMSGARGSKGARGPGARRASREGGGGALHDSGGGRGRGSVGGDVGVRGYWVGGKGIRWGGGRKPGRGRKTGANC